MQTKKKYLILAFLALSINGFAQGKINKPYKYPVTGGKEWAALFEGGENRSFEACQVPENILKNLTTNALIQTCLDYPMIFQVALTNNERRSFEFYASRSNAFQELFTRKNAGKALINRWKNTDIESIARLLVADSSKDHLLVEVHTLALLISHDSILDQLSLKERKELVKISIDKCNQMRKKSSVFSTYSQGNAVFPVARVLVKENAQPAYLRKKEKELYEAYKASVEGELMQSGQNASPGISVEGSKMPIEVSKKVAEARSKLDMKSYYSTGLMLSQSILEEVLKDGQSFINQQFIIM